MFIVQKNEAANKTIRMPIPLIEQLEELAASEDISFNQLVVQCCEYALSNLPENNEKITCTEQFIRKKKQYRTAFVKYMTEHTQASEQSLSQMFTDAIFSTKPYNAALNIDLYSVLCGTVSIDEYKNALEAFFTSSNKKSPAALASGYAAALKHLKDFLEHAGLISKGDEKG